MTLGSRALVTLYCHTQLQSQDQDQDQEVEVEVEEESNNLHCDLRLVSVEMLAACWQGRELRESDKMTREQEENTFSFTFPRQLPTQTNPAPHYHSSYLTLKG